jgi:hypothetical protein
MQTYNTTMTTPNTGTRTAIVRLRRTHQFPKPSVKNFTVSDYLTKFRRGYWRRPFIQRNPDTWPDDHYRELIESIFNNIVTSPFIGSEHATLDVKPLDGGHRTEAILRFLDDKFSITCPTSGEDRKFSELSDDDKAIFMDKDLIFLIYKGLSDLEEEALYFKINNSLPFTPGEIVNGYSTIPICVLARQLGDDYAPKLKELFVRGIEGQNLRADSSNLMLMILRNFHQRKIVKGEKMTKNEELKKICEEFRGMDIDAENLVYNTRCMFDLLEAKQIDHPYLLMILPTIQAIMMKHNIGMSPNADGEDRIPLFADILAKFFHEIEKCDHQLNSKWQSLKRKPEDPNIQGVQNPSSTANCNKRAGIFSEWLELTYPNLP